MKSLRTSVVCTAFLLCAFVTFAQVSQAPVNEPDLNKPRLFSQFPDKILISTSKINDLFNSHPGEAAVISLTTDNSAQFRGEVISTSSKYENKLQTVLIRSTNFEGARLSISRVVDENGQISYRGRILSFSHGDLYELENHEGQYQLVKKNFYDLVNE